MIPDRSVLLIHREGSLKASAVIFDKDGVLAGGYPLWKHVFCLYIKEAKKRGLDIELRAVSIFGVDYPGAVSPLGLCTMQEAHTLLAAAIWESHHLDWGTCRVLAAEIISAAELEMTPELMHEPLPGAKELLVDLMKLVPVAIASSDTEEHIRSMLTFWGLQDMPLIVTAEHVGRPKPFPDMVLWAAEKLGVAPAQIVVIGDAVVDVEMAHSAGAKAISVGSKIPNADGWVETLQEVKVEVLS
ncbi:HAD-IA family hydrolase [Coprothermobacteraceae bacterium]|nr:HAD-IA family hydrolase [Coprothermobacteraceae bacterium]